MKYDTEKYHSKNTRCARYVTDVNGHRHRDGHTDNPRSAEYCMGCRGIRNISINAHPFGTAYKNSAGRQVEMLTAQCRACGDDWQIFAVEVKDQPGHFTTHRNAPKRKDALGANPFRKNQ